MLRLARPNQERWNARMYHRHRDQGETLLIEERRRRAYGRGASNVAVLTLDGGFDPVA